MYGAKADLVWQRSCRSDCSWLLSSQAINTQRKKIPLRSASQKRRRESSVSLQQPLETRPKSLIWASSYPGSTIAPISKVTSQLLKNQNWETWRSVSGICWTWQPTLRSDKSQNRSASIALVSNPSQQCSKSTQRVYIIRLLREIAKHPDGGSQVHKGSADQQDRSEHRYPCTWTMFARISVKLAAGVSHEQPPQQPLYGGEEKEEKEEVTSIGCFMYILPSLCKSPSYEEERKGWRILQGTVVSTCRQQIRSHKHKAPRSRCWFIEQYHRRDIKGRLSGSPENFLAMLNCKVCGLAGWPIFIKFWVLMVVITGRYWFFLKQLSMRLCGWITW